MSTILAGDRVDTPALLIGAIPTLQLAQLLVTSNVASPTLGTIPRDGTAPQVGEGTQILTRTITPKAIGSRLEVDVTTFQSASVAAALTVALFKDGANDAVAVGTVYASPTATGSPGLRYYFITLALTPIVFTVRCGCSAGTGLLNSGESAGATWTNSSITIKEYLQ